MERKVTLANDPKNPEVGELSIDATSLSSVIVDLEVGARLGLKTQQEGLAEVIMEISSNQATYGSRAGITDSDYNEFSSCNARVDEIDKYLEPARKLVELLEETRAVVDDTRHKYIQTIASSIDRRMKINTNDELAARYEKTREYRSASAVKAAKTRKKNAQAEKEAEAEKEPETEKS